MGFIFFLEGIDVRRTFNAVGVSVYLFDICLLSFLG